MELRQLEYFAAVVTQGGFRRAADWLHVAQPTISKQVQALEHELGVRLLDRTSRGAEVTDDGRAVFHHVMRVLDAAARLHASVATPVTDRVVVGYHDAGAVWFMARLLAYLAAALPHVAVGLRQFDGADRTAGLGTSADLVLVRAERQPDAEAATALFTEARMFAVPAVASMVRETRLTLAAASGLRCLDSPVEVLPPDVGKQLDLQRPAYGDGLDDCLAEVATGACVLVPASVAAFYPRVGVAYVPAPDAGTSTVWLAATRFHVEAVRAVFTAVEQVSPALGAPADLVTSPFGQPERVDIRIRSRLARRTAVDARRQSEAGRQERTPREEPRDR